ncbi:MAG: hypothetical protein FWF60_04345 [Oscillospiraceae bacterium]|nr:hypothetical protein [Oscillospiraceae bacterium]
MQEKAKCRVCGAEFSPCKGIAGIPPENQPFNWRKICCSVQCGSQFITSVLESRGLKHDGTPAQAAPSPPMPAPKPRRQAARKPKPVVEQEEPADAAAEDARYYFYHSQ